MFSVTELPVTFILSTKRGWVPACLTKMFDLLLIFLHKGFMLFLLLFLCVLSRISFDINNALQRQCRGNIIDNK